MIQLVAAAALGAVGVYAYSSFRKHMDAIKEEERKAAEAAKPENLTELKKDPKTGVYRPRNKSKD